MYDNFLIKLLMHIIGTVDTEKKLCLTLESLQNECNFFVEYERVFWFLFAIKQPWIIQSLLYTKTSDFFS